MMSEPKYEQDDGPLGERQIESMKLCALVPDDKVAEVEAYLVRKLDKAMHEYFASEAERQIYGDPGQEPKGIVDMGNAKETQ